MNKFTKKLITISFISAGIVFLNSTAVFGDISTTSSSKANLRPLTNVSTTNSQSSRTTYRPSTNVSTTNAQSSKTTYRPSTNVSTTNAQSSKANLRPLTNVSTTNAQSSNTNSRSLTNVSTTNAQSSNTNSRSWSNVSTSNVQSTLRNYSQAIDKQLNVDVNSIFRISTMNKTQKSQFEKYTSTYTKALKVTKESLIFYTDDLNDLINKTDLSDEEKSKQAEDIQIRAKNDYKEAIVAAQTYVRNCSYVMPTLTYQKFLKAFDENFYLDDLDKSQYSIMKY